ncbi:type II toxin-antitoxin system HicB family antitoxin [Amphibacillus sp. Q70]|uniref:type II toxin-antitoxin system HicB family antitoxin n=1 Tax=Amphibacillus sp. Q70 TaxID=3453416 RepID=UPI003F85D461
MAKYLFPAIFDPGTDNSPGYTVTFPDLPGCITEGSNMSEALFMARDVLGGFLYGMEEDNETIPNPTPPSEVILPENAFVSLIEVRTDFVRDIMQNKAVKKTLTIPKWLNDVAEEENINFSHLLQFALKEELNIKSPN